MKIVKFDEIFYSKRLDDYVLGNGNGNATHDESDRLSLISGTEARAMFMRAESPPSWFMRPEISNIVLTALKKGEQVFEA
jgi:ATP sulfurylase